ncbi:MAG: hypothetical protein KDK62_02995 [Chlamydiia bacterium]|nr:hypothetical protein [Chlamydiia bacterium]
MENLLDEGLLKMSQDELLELASKASSFKGDEKEIPSVQARTILLSFMQHDLEIMAKVEDADPENRAGITQKVLKKDLENIRELSPERWEELKSARERLLAYKNELWDKIPHLSNEEIIELERKKHINKRFNVRDKWLPLH